MYQSAKIAKYLSNLLCLFFAVIAGSITLGLWGRQTLPLNSVTHWKSGLESASADLENLDSYSASGLCGFELFSFWLRLPTQLPYKFDLGSANFYSTLMLILGL